MVDVSVIIGTYTEERWDDLVAAVVSLQRQIVAPREIIVVSDHNVRLLERARAHIMGVDVLVTANCGERGLSGVRNQGIAMAKGELVAFLDDDAVAEPDWLLRLSQHFTDQRVLGVGGAVEPLWLDEQPAWFPEEFYWVVGCSYRGLPQRLSVVRNPYGGCTCLRKEVFEAVGGFRSDIGRIGTRPIGGEETELCIRAHQQWPHRMFLYDPQARIRHRIPAYRARWCYYCARCYGEGLSKAVVSKYVGVQESLSSERAYTSKVLPVGIWCGIKDTFVRNDLTGLLRAGAIVAGLVMTMAGYLVGTVMQKLFLHKKIKINTSQPLEHSLLSK